VDVAHLDRGPLRYAKACTVRQLEHRLVAVIHRVILRRSGDQGAHFVLRKDLGQRLPALRQFQPVTRVAGDDAFGDEEPEPGPQAGDGTPDGRRREPDILQVIDEIPKVSRCQL
jgi:hypothetical protein